MAKTQRKRIAKRDFQLLRNDDLYLIKKGDDLDALGVPAKYFPNLKTEKVI
jgi:hypothetical protein